MFAGWTTGLVCIEGQSVSLAIPFVILVLSLIFYITSKLNSNSHVVNKENHKYLLGYIWSAVVVQAALFTAWKYYYGSFIEPTQLNKCGWVVVQVMSFGFAGTNPGPPGCSY